MSNFKSGSGNLDFGGGEDDGEDAEPAEEGTQPQDQAGEPQSSGRTQSASSDNTSSDEESSVKQPPSEQELVKESAASQLATDEYPYFVRRNNVGDERDTRLEIHVRDTVAEQEAAFRAELAEQLGTNEVSKTDAREFALLAAYHYPERVAELMREEGFGALQ